MSSDLQVLDELSDSDELDSLNKSDSDELNSLNKSDSDELNSLNKSDSDELSSLNPSASAAASHYNLHSCSVVDESDAHVSYAYVAISIDNIVELTTYKQAVKSPLCDK